MLRVAFLGLGAMGTPMARRLLAAGFPLSVWNRTPERTRRFVEDGAKSAPSPREAASGADVVATMLADPAAVAAAAQGPDGFLKGLSGGAVWVDFSTVAPDDSRRFAEWARAQGAAFCDAPVAGSTPAAAEGRLGFLVGGDAATVERLRPLFDALGNRLLLVGGVGMGSALKLANNLMFGVSLSAFSEALALAVKLGVPQDRAAEWLLQSSPYLKIKYEHFLATGGGVSQFAAALMKKDFDLALGAAGFPLAAAAGASRDFAEAAAGGHAGDDVTRVIGFLLENARK